MLKSEFIAKAKDLGYSRFKNLIKNLGYHERTLDRYKLDDEISNNMSLALEEFIKSGSIKTTQEPIKATQKKKKVTQKKTTQVTQKKPTQKAVKESTQVQEKQPTQEKIKPTQENKSSVGIDISNDQYHASTNMSVSKIKVIIDNAKEFYHRYVKRDLIQEETEALLIGKLHHTLVLEPHKFNEEYQVINLPSRAVKDDLIKAIEALNGNLNLREDSRGNIVVSDTVEELKIKLQELYGKSNKTIITKSQFETASKTSQKALNSIFEIVHGGKSILKAKLKDILALDKCYVEKTFYGQIDSVNVQIRPDILVNLGGKYDVWFVIDLKTLEVATPDMFVKQGGRFYWDMQEAFYMEVLRQNKINPRAFYFNCVGKKDYSESGFYEWGQSTKTEAQKVMKAGFVKYKYCTENDIYLEGKFDYKNLKFEPIATMEIPAYRQYQFADIGL